MKELLYIFGNLRPKNKKICFIQKHIDGIKYIVFLFLQERLCKRI